MKHFPQLSDLAAEYLASCAAVRPQPTEQEILGVIYVGPWRLDLVRAGNDAWLSRWVDTDAEDPDDAVATTRKVEPVPEAVSAARQPGST